LKIWPIWVQRAIVQPPSTSTESTFLPNHHPLMVAVAELAELDFQMKTGRRDPEAALELFVAERTLAGASVAVLVPARPDAYLYLAVYRLAPRRVVDARWMGEASAVAVYRTEAGRGPEGEPIPHGTLRVR